jgi:hypothetical protein
MPRREVLYHCQRLRLRIAERKSDAELAEVRALERGDFELVKAVGLLIGPPVEA